MSLKIQPDLHYAKSDEWVRVEGNEAVIGISDYAQDALSDIVYVELPSAGDTFEAGKPFGVVESVKAASDILMPVDGEVVAVNDSAIDAPESLNSAPYESWLVRIAMSNPSQVDKLMDAAAYEAYCETREH
ncbi:MAG: glycine cleavage system protein GcvH [Anaerolineae bacterium]|uniref:glycine cleavage system protein GcvH n=1 Tax=Promineifilum sp. TaxID=2664178 RepID=UPI001D7E8354|nr:glycine cleavage system protein GcvH [Anaerolineales bacterium]MCB8934229.1 glycine cleavage system protein GcvH [Promineifilum sp.]MCO5179849.1 glycine cleavage system protein GcvH [Promineifilum sp.]MCW5845590.1 glycine cleavage system protein GcvH [Anaerolineae bacterium]